MFSGMIQRDQEGHRVQVSKDGYQSETVIIQQTMSMATVGDVLAGGAIGYAVDAATGAQCRLVPEHIHVQLQPFNVNNATPPTEDREKNKPAAIVLHRPLSPEGLRR